MQCGIELHPQAEEGTYKIKPSSSFLVATGRLCQKGLNSLEHTIHVERLHTPFKKEKGKEQVWEKESWQASFSQISGRITELQEKHGTMRSLFLEEDR